MSKRRSSRESDKDEPPTKKPKLSVAYTYTNPRTGKLGPLRVKDEKYFKNFTRRAKQRKAARERARAKAAAKKAAALTAERKTKQSPQKDKATEDDSEISSGDEEEAKIQGKTNPTPFHNLTQRFQGHVCVVTGGGRGIGAACAIRFAQEGGTIIIIDYRRWVETVEAIKEIQKGLHAKKRAEALAKYHSECDKWSKNQTGAKPTKPKRIKFKPKVFHKECNVTDPKQVKQVIDEIVSEMGYIDVVFNGLNATGKDYGETKSHELKHDQFDRILQSNLYSTFNVCQAVIPYMLEEQYGRIVNLAAQDGKTGAPKCLAYSAAKAAVINLTKTLGREYAGSGITVNAVAPQYDEYHASKLEKTYATQAAAVPMGRPVDMEELAGAVAFIACEENTYTTGFCYDLTGGTGTY